MPTHDSSSSSPWQAAQPITPEQIAEIQALFGTNAEIRPIPWAPGYAACADGYVISARRWKKKLTVPYRVLRTMRHSGGYPQVNLWSEKQGKVRRLHNLIAETFLGPKPFPKAQVRHLDGNPENNAVTNLAWGTQAENVDDMRRHDTIARGERNGHAKLTETDVARIRVLINHGIPQAVIGKAFGITVGAVNGICRGVNWRHVG